jgi:cyclohexanecarboxyl-CoA dehydrogenase
MQSLYETLLQGPIPGGTVNFELDEETVEFAAATRRFCEERIIPNAHIWDKGTQIERSVLEEMGKLGLLSLRMPEEFGGLGASFTRCGAIAYEIGRADVGLSLMIVNAIMFGELAPLMHESVRNHWGPRVAAGAPFAFTLTEPGAGSDAGAIRTTAVRDGDYYVINGEKATVTHAGTAEMAIVFARTGGPGPSGISAFVVDWNSPGIEKRIYESVGERACKRGQVFYTNLRVPAINLLGREGGGFREAMRFFDYNRGLLALACIGAADKSIEELVEFIKIRETFGQSLARNQGVTFQVAEHMTKLEAAKLLAWKVLWMRDNDIPHSLEAGMIKWFGIREAFEALHTCILLSGWPGYSSELPHERRLRDVMGLELGDGSPEIMKMVVAREVFGRISLPHYNPNPRG